jgi:hypothetical protein
MKPPENHASAAGKWLFDRQLTEHEENWYLASCPDAFVTGGWRNAFFNSVWPQVCGEERCLQMCP